MVPNLHTIVLALFCERQGIKVIHVHTSKIKKEGRVTSMCEILGSIPSTTKKEGREGDRKGGKSLT
jgi:hypothetical protein